MNESISYNQKISALIIVFLMGLLSCNVTMPASFEEVAADVNEREGNTLDESAYIRSVHASDSTEIIVIAE